MSQRYPSRIDTKLAGFGIALPLLTALVFIVNGLSRGGPPWWTVLPLALATALFLWLLLSTWYGFEGPVLLVHCGPFRWRIPLEQIISVRESDSVLSGPAMSMDRLEIRFGADRRMMISPRDKVGFLAELRRQAPRLRKMGQDLSRDDLT